MEIERIGNNKIRCALTEEEIRQLGFDIDDIIGNSETTQRFMQVVLRLVEEREHISMEHLSPMVKAELLQNHSMAITFGSDREFTFKDLIETIQHMLSQIDQRHLNENRTQMTESGQEQSAQAGEESAGQEVTGSMVCALQFSELENICRMSRMCISGRVPESSVYKLDESYYLVLDFTGFTREDMLSFVLAAVEYDDAHFSEAARIAHVEEQGVCIIKNQALETLMAL